MKVLGHETVIAGDALVEQLAARHGQELTRVSLLRFRPREALPAGWLHIYLRPEHSEVIGVIESARQPVLRLIERRHGVQIAEVVQKIVAATLTPAQARTLTSRPGKAALHVTRQYFDARDRLLMATVALYPSDRFSHNTRFRIHNADDKESP